VLEQQYGWRRDEENWRGFVAATASFRFAAGEGLPGRVWRDQKVCGIADVAQDANFPRAAIALRAGLRRAIALPVLVYGEVVGVMEFLGTSEYLPDEELPGFLQAVGSQVGLFIARVRAQEALRQERDFATQVMSLMGQGIAVTGDDRRIEYCNEAFASLVGIPAEKLIGCIPLELLTAAERKKFSNRWWYRASQQRMAFETKLRRADGTEVFVLITSVPRMRQGRPSGHIATATDLTERSRVEETLRQAKEAAESASRAKSDFLATVSHEIRTPMNAVLGMTSLLRETRLDPRQLEFVEAVRMSSESLLEIIDDILDFSKIESSKLTLADQDFDLGELIDGLMDLLAPRAHDKGVELTAILDAKIRRVRKGDRGRLRQILVNLIGNGIKFTAKGEVVLRVEREPEGAVPDGLRFTVSDTGIGIPPEQQAAVFEPFVQGDNTSSRRFEGTGLGLTISKRLVELLGGTLGLDSRPGEGARFWFSIPLPEGRQPELPLINPVLADARVLLLDGHAAAQESVAQIAAARGLRFEMTKRPAVALASLEAAVESGDSFKVVMVDSRSLGEPGQQVAARIAVTLGNARPRIILLTRANDAGLASRRDGVVDLRISKPLKAASLINGLLAVLTGQALSTGVVAVQPAGRPANHALRILMVEDREINQRFARLMLERLGYRADFVVDGQQAVEAARRTAYDVIFMDCQMPVMDGYEATRQIRHDEAQVPADRRRPARIIAMTANAISDNRGKCLEAGMDDFMSKPVRIELVRQVLAGIAPRADEVGAKASPEVALAPESEAGIATLRTEFGDAAAAEMLGLFLRDTPERIAELSRLQGQADWGNLARTAHMLAGSCGIFGLMAIREACLRLEEVGQRRAVGEFGPVFAEIEQGFAVVRPALERRLQELSGAPPRAACDPAGARRSAPARGADRGGAHHREDAFDPAGSGVSVMIGQPARRAVGLARIETVHRGHTVAVHE
jgi:PAS domain S-box-containing protein